MDRIDSIIQHRLFLQHLEENRQAEEERVFCHHDMAHFLDVARIGRIINLEESVGLDPELIYAAALLHDLGKHMQYENGTPHEQASAVIALPILQECGFDEAETTLVTAAIRSHRDASVAGERNLSGVLYRADKASRACYACNAACACNWKGNKKNLTISY